MENQEKTFTQAEVDEIIAKRLSREKGKQPADESKEDETQDTEVPDETSENGQTGSDNSEKQSTEDSKDGESTEKEETPKAEEQPKAEDKEEDAEQKAPEGVSLSFELLNRLAKSELKGAMAMQGIDPQKLDRAVNLIGREEFMDDKGVIDTEKMTSLINDLLTNWPELRRNGDKPMRFGTLRNENNQSSSLIAKAFGNE